MYMKKYVCLLVVLMGLAATGYSQPEYSGKKVLYVNSYHKGYMWSDGEEAGARDLLAGRGIDFRVVYMDTKNNPSEEFCKLAGRRVKQYADEFNPDAIIVADDNAFVYVVMPYYRNASVPVVFCGINWDVSVYGAPYKNTTGMIEVALVEQLIGHLRKFARGDRIGFIGFDAAHERRSISYYDRYIKSGSIRKVFVKDFISWKKHFLLLQNDVDMILVGARDGISGWDEAEAIRFMEANARVPVGSDMENMVSVALIGLVKSSREQGEYAAAAVLRILGGEKPSDIPIVTNKEGVLILNLKIAGALDVVFTPSMFMNAQEVLGLE